MAADIAVMELGCGATRHRDQPGPRGHTPRTEPGTVKDGEAHQGWAQSRFDLSAGRQASMVHVAPCSRTGGMRDVHSIHDETRLGRQVPSSPSPIPILHLG